MYRIIRLLDIPFESFQEWYPHYSGLVCSWERCIGILHNDHLARDACVRRNSQVAQLQVRHDRVDELLERKRSCPGRANDKQTQSISSGPKGHRHSDVGIRSDGFFEGDRVRLLAVEHDDDVVFARDKLPQIRLRRMALEHVLGTIGSIRPIREDLLLQSREHDEVVKLLRTTVLRLKLQIRRSMRQGRHPAPEKPVLRRLHESPRLGLPVQMEDIRPGLDEPVSQVVGDRRARVDDLPQHPEPLGAAARLHQELERVGNRHQRLRRRDVQRLPDDGRRRRARGAQQREARAVDQPPQQRGEAEAVEQGERGERVGARDAPHDVGGLEEPRGGAQGHGLGQAGRAAAVDDETLLGAVAAAGVPAREEVGVVSGWEGLGAGTAGRDVDGHGDESEIAIECAILPPQPVEGVEGRPARDGDLAPGFCE